MRLLGHGHGLEPDQIGLPLAAIDDGDGARGLQERVGDFGRQVHDVGGRIEHPNGHTADAQPVLEPADTVVGERGQEDGDFHEKNDQRDRRYDLDGEA